MYRSQWGSLASTHSWYRGLYFYYKLRMQQSLSGTASHMHYIRTCNEIEGSSDKIIITIVASYTRKKYHSFVRIITCAARSQQCWRQQTRDVFRYSFILWWVSLVSISMVSVLMVSVLMVSVSMIFFSQGLCLRPILPWDDLALLPKATIRLS